MLCLIVLLQKDGISTKRYWIQEHFSKIIEVWFNTIKAYYNVGTDFPEGVKNMKRLNWKKKILLRIFIGNLKIYQII